MKMRVRRRQRAWQPRNQYTLYLWPEDDPEYMFNLFRNPDLYKGFIENPVVEYPQGELGVFNGPIIMYSVDLDSIKQRRVYVTATCTPSTPVAINSGHTQVGIVNNYANIKPS